MNTLKKGAKLATEVKVGDTINSPHSSYWGKVDSISDDSINKLTFNITYTSPIDMKGMKWSYSFFKTTYVLTK